MLALPLQGFVGARHASPVKYAIGVFMIFTSCHKIIARNANNTRHGMMTGEARLAPTLCGWCAFM